MRSVVDRNVVMRCKTVYCSEEDGLVLEAAAILFVDSLGS